MDFTSFPAHSVLSDCITTIEIDNVKVIRVQHEKATAAISLQGGHVISFKPQGEEDLIWMSQQALFDGKAALRGGIPVCWPWFGRIAAPAHGFVRSTAWELVEHRENEQGVMIELAIAESEATQAIWPHQFDLRLQVEVSDQLKVSLVITNTDVAPWAFSGALHTYLNVGDILQTTTTGMGPSYLDGLNNFALTQGGVELKLTDAIDRIYQQPESTIMVNDPVFNRQIKVTNQGHNAAVIWNPWAEGAQSMADMQDDGYQTMLCVESAYHAPSLEAGKLLQSGESHRLITTLSLA